MTTLPHDTSTPSGLRELWRTHKLSFLVTASAVMLVGLHFALTVIPDVYEVQAVLVVRTPEGGGGLLGGGKYDAEIRSTVILTAVAEAVAGPALDATPTARQAAIRELRERLKVVVQRDAGPETEIRISSRGHDREELVTIVGTAARTYVEDRRRRNTTKTEEAAKLRTELTGLSGDFEKANDLLGRTQAALETFRTENAEAMGEAGGDPDTALVRRLEEHHTTQADLAKTQADVAGLEAAEKHLRTTLTGVTQFVETKEVTTVPDPERVALEREIRMMQRKLEEMLRTYTTKHPDVVALETDVLLKKRQLRQLSQRVDQSVTSARKLNPEYAVLKGKLDDTVVKLQIARSSLKRLSDSDTSLKERIDSLRGIAVSHRKLKDDLARAQKDHDTRKTALEVKQKAFDVAAREVEPVPEINTPPKRPETPVGPRRSVYLVAVLIVSLLAGRLAMSAAFRLGTGFRSAYELRRLTGTSVLATVGAVPGTPRARRERLRKCIRFGFVLALLVGVVVTAVKMLSEHSAYL